MADDNRRDLREVADSEMDAADAVDTADDDAGDVMDESAGGLSGRIERTRRKLQKRRSEKRSRKKAQQLKEERARQQRRRRIEQNNPDGAREQAAASLRQGQLLASELGISKSKGSAIASRVNAALEQGGQAVEALDIDNDGDTDVFEAVEARSERGRDLTPTITSDEQPVEGIDMTDLETVGERPVDTGTISSPDINEGPIEDDLDL